MMLTRLMIYCMIHVVIRRLEAKMISPYYTYRTEWCFYAAFTCKICVLFTSLFREPTTGLHHSGGSLMDTTVDMCS